MKKYLLALVLACPLFVFAQAVPATSLVPVAYPFSSVGNVSTVLAAEVNAANAARYAFAPASNGAVWATGSGLLNAASVSPVALSVVSEVPKATVAAAVGRFMGKTLPLLSVGVALYDLANELGYKLDNSSGTVVVKKIDPNICTVAPCYDFQNSSAGLTTWQTSAYGACMAGIGRYLFNNYSMGTMVTLTAYSGGSGGGSCSYITSTGGTYSGGTSARLGTAQSSNEVPSTSQAFTDSVAAKSGWPSTSALARTVVDAIKAGEVVLPSPVTVTGPASSAGPQAVKVDTATGNTTTTTTTNNYNYAGPVVTTTTSTVSVVTNTSTGAEVSRITDTAKPLPPAEVCGIAGKAACNVKVDETGMPDADSLNKDLAKDTYKPIKDFVDNPNSLGKPMPTINWAFALPSGCSVIPVTGAFSDFISSIDVCQFQPMFHNIMSMVWMLGGLFGAISLFMKSSLSE